MKPCSVSHLLDFVLSCWTAVLLLVMRVCDDDSIMIPSGILQLYLLDKACKIYSALGTPKIYLLQNGVPVFILIL